MIVIPPILITKSNIVSCSIPDPDAGEPSLWAAGTAYISGDLVRRSETNKIYESLSAVSTIDALVPELSVYQTPARWREVGNLNRYKMFDYYRNQSTVGTNTITVSTTPLERIDSLCLVGMTNVDTILVQVVHSAGTYTVFDGSNSYIEDSITKYKSTRIFTDIPPFMAPQINLTMRAPSSSGPLSIQYYVHGQKEFIGYLQNEVSIDAINFGTVTRDPYGNASLVKRRNVPKISGNLLVEANLVNRVSYIREYLNAKPALWVGLEDETSDYYESLLILGFYKVFSFNIENPIQVTTNIEIEEI